MSEEYVKPIIADDSGDISLFGSLTSLRRELELQDILDAFDFFDAVGTPLRPVVASSTVDFAPCGERGACAQELAKRLRVFLEATGSIDLEADASVLQLSDLIRRLAPFVE